MTLALIDGDVLAYQACYHGWEMLMKSMGNITDTTKYVSLDENGEKVLMLTKEQERKYLEKAWDRFRIQLQNLLDSVYCSDYLMAVKGPNNFRNMMYPEYKMNRNQSPTKQNLFVPLMRELAVMEEIAVPSEGREADDLLRIWALEAKAAGDDYIICTIDKDLKCIEGRHYMMHVGLEDSQRFIEISADEAMRHYYTQMLKGDPTDNIPGVPRVGNVKAAKMVEKCANEEECQEMVVGAYIEAYGDDWKDMFLSNAKMIHLQRDMNDYFKVSEWPVLRELY